MVRIHFPPAESLLRTGLSGTNPIDDLRAQARRRPSAIASARRQIGPLRLPVIQVPRHLDRLVGFVLDEFERPSRVSWRSRTPQLMGSVKAKSSASRTAAPHRPAAASLIFCKR